MSGTCSILVPSRAAVNREERGLLENTLLCNVSKEKWGDKIAKGLFWTASYFTDPVCKSHQLYRRTHVVAALNPSEHALSHLARKVGLFVGAIGCGGVAVVTTLPGIGLRFVGLHLQTHPFIYSEGTAPEKILPGNGCFSILSWNICCISGGYCITDAGVVEWTSRIDRILKKIIDKDADVNCLYEVFDPKAAFYICEKLKKQGYRHFYFNIGSKAVGVPSGALVASKYKITNPKFTPFSKETLVGRTQFAGKGVFTFNLESRGKKFAYISANHLQHSREPQFPTKEEVKARGKQMQIVVDKANTVQDRCICVTGDLNLDDAEYQTSSWHSRFKKGDHFGNEKTWDGDKFCADLVGQKPSIPLNLDHTMILKGSARSIHTTLVPTHFNRSIFIRKALSDHKGLFSTISVF